MTASPGGPTQWEGILRRHAFADIPASKYPVTVVAFAPDGSIAFTRCLTGPGAMLIPGVLVPGGGPGSVVRLIMVFGDGEYVDHRPGS